MNGQNPAMEAVFNRSKDLLLALWEETATAKRHSDHFSRNFFFPTSQQNFDAMSEEISRLLKQRSITHVVLTAIEQREALKVQIKKLSEHYTRTFMGSNEVEHNAQERELKGLITSLRETTLETVEAIVKWRRELSGRTEYMWRGENYLLAMQADTNFLAIGKISEKFDFDLHSNSLLIPKRKEAIQRHSFDENSAEAGVKFFSPAIPRMAVSPRFPKPRHRKRWDEEVSPSVFLPSSQTQKRPPPPTMGTVTKPVFSSDMVTKTSKPSTTVRIDYTTKPPAVMFNDKKYAVKWVGKPSAGKGKVVTLTKVVDTVAGMVRLSDNTVFENPPDRTPVRGSTASPSRALSAMISPASTPRARSASRKRSKSPGGGPVVAGKGGKGAPQMLKAGVKASDGELVAVEMYTEPTAQLLVRLRDCEDVVANEYDFLEFLKSERRRMNAIILIQAMFRQLKAKHRAKKRTMTETERVEMRGYQKEMRKLEEVILAVKYTKKMIMAVNKRHSTPSSPVGHGSQSPTASPVSLPVTVDEAASDEGK